MKSLIAGTFALLLSCATTDTLAQNICARYHKNLVDSLAKTVDPVARLFLVFSDSVDADGKCASWHYAYMKGGNPQTRYYFHTTIDSVVYDKMVLGDMFGYATFSKDWFDSDSALALANSQGGSNFIHDNPRYKIRVNIGEGVVPHPVPLWTVIYNSTASDGNYLYLEIVGTTTDVNRNNPEILPTKCELYQNYPNPFNPSTSISFDVPRLAHVRLSVYNLVGQEVAVLADGVLPQGHHYVHWRPENASSGVYFVRLQAGEFRATRKMVLIR